MSLATLKRKTNATTNISRNGFTLIGSLSTKAYISTKLVNKSGCDTCGSKLFNSETEKKNSFNIGGKSQLSYILEKSYDCGNNYNVESGSSNCCNKKGNIVKSNVVTGSISSSQHIRNIAGKC